MYLSTWCLVNPNLEICHGCKMYFSKSTHARRHGEVKKFLYCNYVDAHIAVVVAEINVFNNNFDIPKECPFTLEHVITTQ